MDCLKCASFELQFHYDHSDQPDMAPVHAIKITEPALQDDFEISGKLAKKKLDNATVTEKSGPDIIDGTYVTLLVDDDTLLMMIDELNGNVHLICNDCYYLQHAMINFAFNGRKHFNSYRDECDIKHVITSEKCYRDPFIKAAIEYFEGKAKEQNREATESVSDGVTQG